MRKPLIGITTYGRDERGRYTLPSEYVSAVQRAGGLPLLIPPVPDNAAQYLALVDGLVLAGGGDIDPQHYGGTQIDTLYSVDAERDQLELALARAALQARQPTLAICRGMQIVNVCLGGTLIGHLPDEVGEAVLHRKPPREPTPHAVSVKAGSRLAAILGATTLSPMSWHHQAIRQAAPGFEAVAHAPDGTIEAAELKSHPWLIAVQWHPELTAHQDPIQQRLFDALVAAARDTLTYSTGARCPPES
ncbi:MAG TPA: gamma-glutamyl-gamma-aminobutyrate hydrolase family protein [Candidatus Binatia bacterium]|nr:gamma-glutamyl-gamma-aminobutyrate hydrolase family protein [Candidatus Binatia bacterium]